ncbi:hypothetical protein MMC15_001569 [Xylographa vitiligo]|nr:hypothetical protein [Xylographa vitiligo]
MSTAARLIFYTKDPSNIFDQAIWGGLECLTAAHTVIAPTLCSLFSTAADTERDEEARNDSRGIGSESTENIISPTSSTSRIPTSNNIVARYRPGTTAWKMCRGQLHRVRNAHYLSRGKGKSIRMVNLPRPRAPRAPRTTPDSQIPHGLGNHATHWANSQEFAPEATYGIFRTREVHVTREAWTDEDGPQVQTVHGGIAIPVRREAWDNEANQTGQSGSSTSHKDK